MMLRRVLIAFGCIAAGGVVAQLVYRVAIIPRLAGWHEIPLAWYPPLVLPVALGFIAAGLVIRGIREVLITASVVALIALLPGGHDSAPALSVIGSFTITAVVLGAIAWLASRLRHQAAPV